MTSIAQIYADRAKSKAQPEQVTIPDERFKSSRFKDKVKRILTSIGMDCNYGNFKAMDGIIDWESYDNRYLAICYVKDHNETLYNTTIGVWVAAETKEQALKKLDKKTYEFIKFW